MAEHPPRLDKGTIYDHGGGWLLHVWDYPDGGKEAVIRFAPMGEPRRNGGAAARQGEAERDTSAPRRARTQIRRHVRGAGCDRMLTLTYRENFTDREASDGHVVLLLRRIRRWEPGIHYVAVPELQKRGAIHWHIALNRWLCVRKVRAAWLEIIGPLSGNIDLQHFPNPARQAKYLAKYIGKDVDQDKARGMRKRYKRSRGLVVPQRYIRAESLEEAFTQWAYTSAGEWDGTFHETEGTYWVQTTPRYVHGKRG